MELAIRHRRLRKDENIRRMARETYVNIDNLMFPLFVLEGKGIKKEVVSMPGVYQYSLDMLYYEIENIIKLKIPAVLLFGVPQQKDEFGTQAYNPEGIIQRALRGIKNRFPEILLAADVCLCEYTSHGHCGIADEHGTIENDSSVKLLVDSSLSYVQAGADIIAPSDMMDGRIGEIRKALEKNRYHDTVIMSYSAKYASAFYGPFREAACSAPAFGDRKTYQMDCSNIKEAFREVRNDIEEGADIIMVKPALPYLDVVHAVSDFFDVPVAAYSVSGEYSMLKSAALNGWINEKAAVLETITSIKRAGANIIITYYAQQIAQWLREI